MKYKWENECGIGARSTWRYPLAEDTKKSPWHGKREPLRVLLGQDWDNFFTAVAAYGVEDAAGYWVNLDGEPDLIQVATKVEAEALCITLAALAGRLSEDPE